MARALAVEALLRQSQRLPNACTSSRRALLFRGRPLSSSSRATHKGEVLDNEIPDFSDVDDLSLDRPTTATIGGAATEAAAAEATDEAENDTEEHPTEEPERAPRFHPGIALVTNLRGVTFDGRQDAVAALSGGDRLILARDYGNAHDLHAVAALSMDGTTHYGFIRRLFAPCFMFDDVVGTVLSAGYSQNAAAFYARVRSEPAAPPLRLDLRPVEDDELEHKLSSAEMDALRKVWQSQPRAQCDICGRKTGAGSASALGKDNLMNDAPHLPTVQCLWSVRPHERIQRFQMALSLCNACAFTRKALQLPDIVRKSYGWKRHLRRVTGLNAEETESYMRWLFKRRRGWRMDEDWTVDVSLAQSNKADELDD